MAKVIKNFNFDAIAKAKARVNTVDPVEALKKIAPQIDKLAIGDAIAIAVPAGEAPKKFLAGVRAKAVATMREGSAFAGRVFKTAYRPGENDVILYREADGKALPRRVGGRPKGSKNKPEATMKVVKAVELKPAIEKAKEHLTGVVVKDLTKPDKETIEA